MDPEKLKIAKAYRKGAYTFKQRRYYDYPDGQDIVGKLLYTNKIAGLIGIAFGSARCLSYPPVKGFGPKLFVIARYSAPYIGIASAFTLTTYYSTIFRKVDDPYNYALGGLAAGSIIGLASGRTGFGITSAVVFAVFGYIFKTAKMMGINIVVPNTNLCAQTLPSYVQRNRDFTWTKERPRTWTRELPEETAP